MVPTSTWIRTSTSVILTPRHSITPAEQHWLALNTGAPVDWLRGDPDSRFVSLLRRTQPGNMPMMIRNAHVSHPGTPTWTLAWDTGDTVLAHALPMFITTGYLPAVWDTTQSNEPELSSDDVVIRLFERTLPGRLRCRCPFCGVPRAMVLFPEVSGFHCWSCLNRDTGKKRKARRRQSASGLRVLRPRKLDAIPKKGGALQLLEGFDRWYAKKYLRKGIAPPVEAG